MQQKVQQKKEVSTCQGFMTGCSCMDGQGTRIITLPDGRIGYIPLSCRSDIPCGFYPIWDREQFRRFFGEEPFPQVTLSDTDSEVF